MKKNFLKIFFLFVFCISALFGGAAFSSFAANGALSLTERTTYVTAPTQNTAQVYQGELNMTPAELSQCAITAKFENGILTLGIDCGEGWCYAYRDFIRIEKFDGGEWKTVYEHSEITDAPKNNKGETAPVTVRRMMYVDKSGEISFEFSGKAEISAEGRYRVTLLLGITKEREEISVEFSA